MRLGRSSQARWTACNLSDIFEYMSADAYEKRAAGSWFEPVPRGADSSTGMSSWHEAARRYLPTFLRSLRALARGLHGEDKAFFYRDLVIEEVR